MIDFFLEESSIDTVSYQSITGIICIQVDSLYFPEQHWNDNIVTILDWWSNGFIALNDGINNSYDFHFMDGPFEYRIYKTALNVYMLELKTGRLAGITKVEMGEIDLQGTIDNFAKALNRLILFFRRSRSSNDEIKKLEQNYSRLMATIALKKSNS